VIEDREERRAKIKADLIYILDKEGHKYTMEQVDELVDSALRMIDNLNKALGS
jgi:hypothetical protein